MGLSAWKGIGSSQWSLRMNPSSGNLHPTEVHLILPAVESLSAGVYHYNPLNHALEPRAVLSSNWWKRIKNHFGTEGFLIVLTSIFWRESWKYGERAFRYCHHDVGHALAGICFSANLQGWNVTYLNALSDKQIEMILGFDQTDWPLREHEDMDLMCWVSPNTAGEIPRDLPLEIIQAFSKLSFSGIPGRLSQKTIDWEIIYTTAAFTAKPESQPNTYDYGHAGFIDRVVSPLPASQIIRQRRSAVAFNRNGSIPKDVFFSILDKTVPRNACAPFDVGIGASAIHLFIFVHNVIGLEPGLYFFFRNDIDREEIKRCCRSDFEWKVVEKGLPLFFLKQGEYRQEARVLSCDQEIAGNSSFSLGMIARFKTILQNEAFRYRHLFWESGMIGQVLYLEAEAHGFRGTGIGCYFDDAVHELLGFKTIDFQSLYHFTIGESIEDKRLKTYAPYFHLQK